MCGCWIHYDRPLALSHGYKSDSVFCLFWPEAEIINFMSSKIVQQFCQIPEMKTEGVPYYGHKYMY